MRPTNAQDRGNVVSGSMTLSTLEAIAQEQKAGSDSIKDCKSLCRWFDSAPGHQEYPFHNANPS